MRNLESSHNPLCKNEITRLFCKIYLTKKHFYLLICQGVRNYCGIILSLLNKHSIEQLLDIIIEDSVSQGKAIFFHLLE